MKKLKFVFAEVSLREKVKMKFVATLLLSFGLWIASVQSTTVVSDAHWKAYKVFIFIRISSKTCRKSLHSFFVFLSHLQDEFGKVYGTTIDEANARYYYNYNFKLINDHNYYYNLGSKSFKLAANQFTDMMFKDVLARFPITTAFTTPNAAPLPPRLPPTVPSDYNLADSITFRIDDQGTACNSGWAYSAAKSVEILTAVQDGQPRFSAQNLIDCAGKGVGCVSQVPLAAFDYLTLANQRLHLLSEYPNNPFARDQVFCLSSTTSAGVKLLSYASLPKGDETKLQQLLVSGFGVIVEFNALSFEFVHYAGGLFTSIGSVTGSHFMIVVGYDATSWILLNSFGDKWGDRGYIRIPRNTSKSIVNSAILPLSAE